MAGWCTSRHSTPPHLDVMYRTCDLVNAERGVSRLADESIMRREVNQVKASLGVPGMRGRFLNSRRLPVFRCGSPLALS